MPAKIVSIARLPDTPREGLEKPTTTGYEFRLAFDGAVELEQVARLMPRTAGSRQPILNAHLRYASDTTRDIVDVLIDNGDALVDALVRERGRPVDPVVEDMAVTIVHDELGQTSISGLAEHLVELATRPDDAVRYSTDLSSFQVAWVSHMVLPKASHHAIVASPGMRRLFQEAWEDARGWEEASAARHAEVTERMIDLLAPERDGGDRTEFEFEWGSGVLRRFDYEEFATDLEISGAAPFPLGVVVAQVPVQPPRWTQSDGIEPGDLQALDLLALPAIVKSGLGAAAGLASRAVRSAGTRMAAWGAGTVDAYLSHVLPYGVTSVVSDIETAAARLVATQIDDVVEATAYHTTQLLSPEVVAALPRFSAVHARLALPIPPATPMAEVERVLAAHGRADILSTTAGQRALLTVDEAYCIIRFGTGTKGGTYGVGLYKCSDAPIVVRALAEDIVEHGIPQYERYGALLQMWPGKKLGRDVLEEAARTHIQVQEVGPGSQLLLSLVGPQKVEGKFLVPRDLPFDAYHDADKLAEALALPGGLPQVAVISGPRSQILTGTIGGRAVGPVPLTTAGLEQFLTQSQAGTGGALAFIASILGTIVDWESGKSDSTKAAEKPSSAWPDVTGPKAYDSDGDGEADMTLGATRERGDELAPEDDAAHPTNTGSDGPEQVPPQPAGSDGGTRPDGGAETPGTTFDMEAEAARRAAEQSVIKEQRSTSTSGTSTSADWAGMSSGVLTKDLQPTALDFPPNGEWGTTTQRDPYADQEVEAFRELDDIERGPGGDEADSTDDKDALSHEEGFDNEGADDGAHEGPENEESDDEGPDDEGPDDQGSDDQGSDDERPDDGRLFGLGHTDSAASQDPLNSPLQSQAAEQTLFQELGVPDPILELAVEEMAPAPEHDDGLDDLFDADVSQLLESSPSGDADDTKLDGTDDDANISHSGPSASSTVALAPTRQESDYDEVEEADDGPLWQQGPTS